jgi:hypothetical protein
MKYCLKTGKQGHPNELSPGCTGGSPVIVLGMDAKVHKPVVRRFHGSGRTIEAVTIEPSGILVLFDDQIEHEDQDSRTCDDTAGRQSKIR